MNEVEDRRRYCLARAVEYVTSALESKRELTGTLNEHGVVSIAKAFEKYVKGEEK